MQEPTESNCIKPAMALCATRRKEQESVQRAGEGSPVRRSEGKKSYDREMLRKC